MKVVIAVFKPKRAKLAAKEAIEIIKLVSPYSSTLCSDASKSQNPPVNKAPKIFPSIIYTRPLLDFRNFSNYVHVIFYLFIKTINKMVYIV